MLEDFSLELLHDTVYLYSIPPEYKLDLLGKCLPVLIGSRFFHILQSDTEFSFFISPEYEKSIEELRSRSSVSSFLQRTHDEYCILRIYQSENAISEYGVVYRLSKHFFEKRIPILYSNSYNNNYIFVPKKHLSELDDWIEY